MGSYFDRGASAGGHDEGVFNRKDITGPSGVGTGARGGPGPVADENKGIDEYDPAVGEAREDETIESAPPPDNIDRGAYPAASEYARDPNNPNIARPRIDPLPQKEGVIVDETAGNDSPIRADESYGRIIDGSDSARTGTSWSAHAYEDAQTVDTPRGSVPEGEDPADAKPTRNTGRRLQPDPLNNVGSWSTIDNTDSAGSPTGES